jgi:hypothetical protein
MSSVLLSLGQPQHEKEAHTIPMSYQVSTELQGNNKNQRPNFPECGDCARCGETGRRQTGKQTRETSRRERRADERDERRLGRIPPQFDRFMLCFLFPLVSLEPAGINALLLTTLLRIQAPEYRQQHQACLAQQLASPTKLTGLRFAWLGSAQPAWGEKTQNTELGWVLSGLPPMDHWF